MEDQARISTSSLPRPAKYAGPSIQVPPGMSKNAAKKLARKQKLEATKHDRRAAERLKKKDNKRARFLAAQQDSDSTKNTGKRRNSDGNSTTVQGQIGTTTSKKPKPGEGESKEYFDARLVIDCGFDELMAEKESNSMTQQLMYLYSANRAAKVPFGEIILTGQEIEGNCLKDVQPDQLSLVPKADSQITRGETGEGSRGSKAGSIENNRIGQAMDGKLRGVWRRWKRVTIYKHGGLESLLSSISEPCPAAPTWNSASGANSGSVAGRYFPAEEFRQTLHRIPLSNAIYLTADTDDTLMSLEAGMTYIIGGIVDKNRYKGLCRAKADRLGIRAAKLPLSQEMLLAVERSVRLRGESIQDEAAGDKDVGEEGEDEKGFVGRKVLTVNQVVEILTAWTETRDWVKALEKALPRRKLKQRGPTAKTAVTATRCKGADASIADCDEEQDAARNA
ncbi:related to TRM10 - tRNA methyltransferase [Melanopsichium pennsylvanicum]|uniref:tRNA (guanine(9)-N1)-methyltransferase n=2 Tax=Melanopsichium pennsylvanicum TaxID=63383 RepID=A0AAJ5C7G1_9BASI|nr:related to TRM10-tRNA methyltransferase [Melanopsichium pennsylvanicum 4]SNX86533.1 related to TRM10 - tRNA methyltransferase [Melanopsichium pennsylvanicum]